MNLAIAIVLSAVTTTVAQTVVRVPSNCTVVVTDTTAGGVYGLGGRVTSGGVVTMPDGVTPNGGTFTFGSSQTIVGTPSWSLSGDLSNTTSQGTYQISGVTATIVSFNKSVRQSEATLPSQASWARSKGRVSISYTTSVPLCPGILITGGLTFDVFKTYTATPITNIPRIVGPDCVPAGTLCTYSVDQIASDNANDQIGFDKYYWTGLPAVEPNSTYYSADNSSITFRPTTNAAFTLKCCIGQANPWNGGTTTTQAVTGTTCCSLAIGAAPPAPTTGTPAQLLSTTFPRCVATGTPTLSILYNSLFPCTFSAPNTGWTVTQTTTSVTINFNGSNNPGVLIATVTNGACTPLTVQYQINRSFAAPSVAIAPVIANNTCLAINSSNNLFAISSSASANPTTWTITPTLPLTPQTLNSTVAVNVPTTASAGLYTLTARSTACPGDITSQFRVRPNVPTITSSNCVVSGALTPKTFTCTTTPGATYTWALPIGWTPNTVTTSANSITATPSSTTATLTGVVTVTANGVAGCNSSATATITYASQAPTGVVASCFSVGIAGGGSVTFTNPLPGTYTATMISTAGGTNVITSQGPLTPIGNSLSFNTSALTAGTYNITITHNSGCNTATSTTQITVNASATITPVFTPNVQDQYLASTTLPLQPAVIYEWQTCTAGGACTPIGTNSALLALNGTPPPPAGNQICVTVYNQGSTCKTRVCTPQGVFSRPLNTNESVESIEGVSIFPNPNSGNFNITIADFKKEATATLYDFNGKKIQDFTLTKGVNKIENESLAKGTYILFISVDDKTDAKQIIIK